MASRLPNSQPGGQSQNYAPGSLYVAAKELRVLGSQSRGEFLTTLCMNAAFPSTIYIGSSSGTLYGLNTNGNRYGAPRSTPPPDEQNALNWFNHDKNVNAQGVAVSCSARLDGESVISQQRLVRNAICHGFSKQDMSFHPGSTR